MNGDLKSWDKFCNYLWFDKKLNIWLDISKINFTSKEITNLEDKFIDVFLSIKELENGSISNIDEKTSINFSSKFFISLLVKLILLMSNQIFNFLSNQR